MLSAASCNIEGIRSNVILMDSLLNDFNIVAIQEHWLFQFESIFFTGKCADFNKDSICRSVDDKEPIGLHQRPRGFGGVAFAWDRTLSHRLTIIPDGNHFILPILMKDNPQDLCLINVYLPCRGNHSEAEFGDALDILSTIIDKYKVSHRIMLLGDFNASIIDRRCSRDTKFSKWCKAMMISLPPDYPLDGTHLHHRGSGTSTIDYILTLEQNVASNIRLLRDRPDNTSSHIPLAVDICCNFNIASTDEPSIQTPSINWNKCDKPLYQEILDSILPQLSHPDMCVEATLETITDALQYAAKQSTPKQRGPRKQAWNGEVSRAMAANKSALDQWNTAGRPREGPHWDKRKNCKKLLRSAQRKANADKRNKLYTDVMVSCTRDTRVFHKLIRQQQSTRSLSGDKLQVNGKLITSQSEVLSVWTEHFKALATPHVPSDADSSYDKLISDDLLVMEWAAEDHPDDFIAIDRAEVEAAFRALKCNKAADLTGLKAEHLKYATPSVINILTEAFNIIYQRGLPTHLQGSYILPIHKKGKDPLDVDCYRGITITPIMSKALEHVVLNRISKGLKQNPLQYGFTKGLSPTLAILSVTEAIADASDRKCPLYLLTVDVRKAFDVVRQDSLCHKLYHLVDSHSWKVIRQNLHTIARVKLRDSLGEPFDVGQGVGQGKILSTHCYKQYVNDLLDRLSEARHGYSIGETYMGAPTCADDIILVCDNPTDLQTQLNAVASYARQEHYTIHPKKSQCVTYRVTHPFPPLLNNSEVPFMEKLTHLGIDRYPDSMSPEDLITDRISLANRTAYALMGSGFHGVNGISPKVAIHIYQIYVLPRLLYGLEAVILKPSQIAELGVHHRRTLRQLQSLPTRVARCAIHLLAGMPPIEALLDIQLASLLLAVAKTPGHGLLGIGLHQLSMKDSKSSSWFLYCARRLTVYGLDPIDIILGQCCHQRIKSTILQYWDDSLKEEALTKSTLKHLDVSQCSCRRIHPVWSTIDCSTADTRKALVKARLLCGTYTLQANRAVFNQYKADPSCLMCEAAPEDRCHFILHCPALEVHRQKYLGAVTDLVPDFHNLTDDDKINNILDSNSVKNRQVKCDFAGLEAASRSYIYSIHCKRTASTSS